MKRLLKSATVNTQNSFEEGGNFQNIGSQLQEGLKFDFLPTSITGYSNDNAVEIFITMNNGDKLEYALIYDGGEISEHTLNINGEVLDMGKDLMGEDPVKIILDEYRAHLINSKGWTL